MGSQPDWSIAESQQYNNLIGCVQQRKQLKPVSEIEIENLTNQKKENQFQV